MPTSTTSARSDPALPNPDQPARHDRHQHEPSLAESLTLGTALGVCVAAQLPRRLAGLVGIREWVLALVVAVAVVSLARSLARAAFTLRRSLSAPSPTRASAVGGWATKEARILGATFSVGTVVAVPLYLLLRATPLWWFVAWLVAAAATALWQVAMPLLLQARTGSLAPAAGPLAERLDALAARAGIDLPAGVVVASRSANRCANAYVVGLGPTRRVVLEQAVAAWPPELVDQAVAHELGHVRLGHAAHRLPLAILAQLATLVLAAAVLSWAPLLHLAGVSGVADPFSYPLLLAVGALVVLPARCLLAWNARAQERAADRFALRLLDRPDDFAAMLRRAADDSQAPRDLPWWRRVTASHPPLDERAALTLANVPTGLQPTGA